MCKVWYTIIIGLLLSVNVHAKNPTLKEYIDTTVLACVSYTKVVKERMDVDIYVEQAFFFECLATEFESFAGELKEAKRKADVNEMKL